MKIGYELRYDAESTSEFQTVLAENVPPEFIRAQVDFDFSNVAVLRIDSWTNDWDGDGTIDEIIDRVKFVPFDDSGEDDWDSSIQMNTLEVVVVYVIMMAIF